MRTVEELHWLGGPAAITFSHSYRAHGPALCQAAGANLSFARNEQKVAKKVNFNVWTGEPYG
jgi:hypothetical protein